MFSLRIFRPCLKMKVKPGVWQSVCLLCAECEVQVLPSTPNQLFPFERCMWGGGKFENACVSLPAWVYVLQWEGRCLCSLRRTAEPLGLELEMAVRPWCWGLNLVLFLLDLFIVSKSRWLRDGENRIQVRGTSRPHSLALLIWNLYYRILLILGSFCFLTSTWPSCIDV